MEIFVLAMGEDFVETTIMENGAKKVKKIFKEKSNWIPQVPWLMHFH